MKIGISHLFHSMLGVVHLLCHMDRGGEAKPSADTASEGVVGG